jgi:lipid-binding SYLF domain-containing protein
MQRSLLATLLAAGAAGLIAGCSTTATTTSADSTRAAIGAGSLSADQKRELDVGSRATLNRLYEQIPSSRALVQNAAGVLVFPRVIDAGLVIGGEYGLGELRTGSMSGNVGGYYRTASGSIGPQIGAQSKALVLLFRTPEALAAFRNAGSSWQVGADASLAVAKVGANGEIDVNVARAPTIAFVMTNAGLMADASLSATRISRIPD